LKSENGWLAITGLFWLKEGDNRFGSGGTNEVILPADSSPEQAGILRLLNGRITLIVNDGSPVTVNGIGVKSTNINLDSSQDEANSPDKIVINSVTLQLIKRGKRYGIRPRDKNRKALKEFTGERWFPVSKEYCIE